MPVQPVRSRWWLARELLRRPLTPTYASHKDLDGAVAVIAVPFNCYLDRRPPDKSNAAIAEIARVYMRKCGLRFIGQWEHYSLLRQEVLPMAQFPSRDGERVQSQRLVRYQAGQVEELNKDRKIFNNKVILVGMPEHLGRVVALCEYFGLHPVVPQECKGVPYDPSDRPGAQTWCKSRQVFVKYERRIARPGTIGKAILGLL